MGIIVPTYPLTYSLTYPSVAVFGQSLDGETAEYVNDDVNVYVLPTYPLTYSLTYSSVAVFGRSLDG
jgi:hypothetical protein